MKSLKIGKLTIEYAISDRGYVTGALFDDELNSVSISAKGLERLIAKYGSDSIMILDRHGVPPKVVYGRFKGLKL